MTTPKKALTFAGLVDSIKTVDLQLTQQASKAVNISLTLRNWLIGFHISEFELNGSDRAGYGDRLLESLSAELEKINVSACGKRQLYQYLRFYQTYPQIVRSITAQLRHMIPNGVTNIQKKVRSATAQLSIDQQILLQRLSLIRISNTWLPSRTILNVPSTRSNASGPTGRCAN